MSDFLVPTIDFGSVGDLVPTPEPSRAISGADQPATVARIPLWEFHSLAPGGGVVEVICYSGTDTTLAVDVVATPPTTTGQPIVALSGTIHSGFSSGLTTVVPGTAAVVSPLLICQPALDWFVPRGANLRIFGATLNLAGVLGVQWREFDANRGPR